MESKIIDHIKTEYDPEIILLGGSRAKGKETEKSDWDLFLIGTKKGREGFAEFENQQLDITFKNWPEEDKPLTIPSGPLWPLKVLFDTSEGKLIKVLHKTEEYFGKGPLTLYNEAVQKRFEKLSSWKRKMEKYSDNPLVEFFYAGVFYEFAIRAWFELQDRWSLSPAEAVSIIQEEDKKFHGLLISFISAGSAEQLGYAKELLHILEAHRLGKL